MSAADISCKKLRFPMRGGIPPLTKKQAPLGLTRKIIFTYSNKLEVEAMRKVCKNFPFKGIIRQDLYLQPE